MRQLLWIPALLGAATLCASENPRRVSEIRFEPRVQPLASEVLDELVVVEADAPLDPDAVQTSIQNLFATGRYDNIEAEAIPEGEGAVVLFRTQAALFIGDVVVEGVDGPPNQNQLVNATRLRLGQLYSPSAVAQARQNLRRLLIENGFPTPVVDFDAVERAEGYQMDVTFSVREAPRARIGEVILPPDFPMTEAEVRRVAGWKLGKPLTDPRIEDGLTKVRRRLYDDDFLQAKVDLVGRDFNPDRDQVNLVLNVVTGPRVRVELEGYDLSKGKQERLLPVLEEGIVDEDLLEEGASNLRDYLETRGYFNADVSYDRERTGPEDVLVRYTIDRGPRRKLTSISVDGPFFFDEATIRERLTIRPAGFELRRGRFSTRLLNRDLEAIENLYAASGYLNADVQAEVVETGDKKIAVAIHIDEGSATFVESLRVEGMSGFPQDEYRFASAEGQPFSETSVATDRDLILAEYFDAGFQDASFDWSVEPIEDSNRVVLSYTIQEGERLFVQRPIVSGLVHTDPDLVNARIVLRPGDPLSQTAMFESQRRLYDLGIFSKVETALQNPDGEEPAKNVLFELEEARRWTVGFGGGAEFARLGGGRSDLSSPVGEAAFAPRVTLELSRLNFRGKGNTITMRSRVSTLQQRALFTVENPRWTGSEKWKATVSALWDTSRNVRTFTGSRLEGALQLEHRLSKPSTALYRYIYRRTTIDQDTLQITPLLIPLNAQPVRVGLFSGTYIQDKRDDPTDSTRGIFNSVDLSFASGYWGSQPDFARVLGQNSTYHRLTKKFVLARTTQVGVMAPWSDQERLDQQLPTFGSSPDPRIPIAERFFAGGANAHRGFPVNQAGPRDPTTGFPIGGGAEFINSFELRFPLVGENIGGVLFHDAGNIYSRIEDLSFSPSQKFRRKEDGVREFDFDYMVHAVGFGLRYGTPVGPVRIDLAYSVNPPRFIGFSGTRQQLLAGEGTLREQRISGFQFHFSLGQTF